MGAGSITLLLAGIVVTESRGGLIATIAAVGFVFFVSKASFAKKAVVAALFFVGGIAALPKDVANRYASIGSAAQTDESAQSRLAVWTAGARIIRDHPVFGVGVTNFEIVYGSRYIDRIGAGDVWRSAHNSLVEAGAELGVVGLIAWCIFMFGTIPLLWKRRADLRAAAEAIEDGEIDSLLIASDVPPEELVEEGNRWILWSECMMASMIGFLVSAMFLSKAFDISTVIFVGIAVAGALVMDRWIDAVMGVE